MTAIVLEIVFLPVLVLLMLQIAKRQKIRRAQRIEAYKQSPESHILHLND